MNALLDTMEKISRFAAITGGTILLLTCFMIAIEVVLRKGFAISLGGADELSNYALAISCSWAFGFALFRKAHIRIDVLYTRLDQRLRFALDILSLSLFAIFMTLVTYFAGVVLYTSVIRHSVANTPLATPLWIPQSIWFIGLAGFCLIIYFLLAGVIYNLLCGRPQKATQLAGACTLEEEIEEEGPSAASQSVLEGGVQ